MMWAALPKRGIVTTIPSQVRSGTTQKCHRRTEAGYYDQAALGPDSFLAQSGASWIFRVNQTASAAR